MKKNISTSVRNLLSFCFVLLFTIAYAQTTVTEIFQYTGLVQNFTVPQGVTSIKIEAWGGGGAGGGAVNDGEFLTGVKLGSGGGGSAFAGNNSLAVTAGAIYNVFVGKGGVGTANGNMGENGGDSYFRLSTNSANIVMAKGGYGGSGSASGGPNQSQGGQANASDGAIKNSGGNGTSRSGVTSGSGGAAPNGGGTGGAGIGDWFEVASGNIGGFPGGGGGGAKVGWLNNSKQAGGNGGNGQVKITYTITLPAISITPASATICSGAKVNLKASPAISSGIYTYAWTIVGSPTVLGIGESIDVSPTTTTTYRVTGTFSRGGLNITKTKDVTITITAALPVSVAISSDRGNTICQDTSVVFRANPTNGGTSPSYQWKLNGSNVGSNSPTYTNSTLSNGDIVTVVMTSNASPCATGSPATSNTITMRVGMASTFNGSVWDNGIPNNNGLSAIIAGNYSTSQGDIKACNCTVNPGKTLTIEKDTYVELVGALINNGNVVIESDGNLKQLSSQQGINNLSNKPITVRRDLDFTAARKEYNYLSTPVVFASGQSYKTLYPGVGSAKYPSVLYYVESTRYFLNSSGANILGRGSAVKEASIDSGITQNRAEFIGIPFVGDFTYQLAHTASGDGFNLVGNPYPTNIDLDELYTLNKDNIKAEFRFWDNKANNIYEQQGANYSGSAYAIYNAKSITGVLRTSTASALAAPRTPNKILKVGQGFMVQALGSGKSLLWSNPATLKTTDNTGSLFFGKTASLNRYWLRFKTPNDLVLSSAIVYISSLSNAKGMEDSDVDSNESNSFYTFTTDGSGVVINGRSSFTTADQVPIGVTHYQDGKYEISLGDQEGVFANAQAIYLKDNDLKTITDLSKGNYSYFGEKGSFTNRFEIVYTQSNFDGVLSNKENSIGGVKVYLERDDFVVDAKDKDINQVSIYDMQGRLLKTIMDEKRVIRISKSSLGKGIFLLRIVQGSTITTKKIKN